MNKILILTISALLSNMALAEQTTSLLKCSINDRNSADLKVVDGTLQLHVHNPAGLNLARALSLEDVGRYWRYSSAAVNFTTCSFTSPDRQQFECEDTAANLTMGWPAYEVRFAKVSVHVSKAAEDASISLRVQDETRGLDVTDHFKFRNSDCKGAMIETEMFPFPSQESSFSCDPKCVDGIPYCCIGSQCFKQ